MLEIHPPFQYLSIIRHHSVDSYQLQFIAVCLQGILSPLHPCLTPLDLFISQISGWDLLEFGITHTYHDDVIKWKQFPRYCPFVQGIHRSPVDSPHKGIVTWTFDVLLSVRTNCWTKTWLAGNLTRRGGHLTLPQFDNVCLIVIPFINTG